MSKERIIGSVVGLVGIALYIVAVIQARTFWVVIAWTAGTLAMAGWLYFREGER